MKQVINHVRGYMRHLKMRDFALIKICLCSLGVLLGLTVSQKNKKPAMMAAFGVFTASLAAVMAGFLKELSVRDDAAELVMNNGNIFMDKGQAFDYNSMYDEESYFVKQELAHDEREDSDPDTEEIDEEGHYKP